MPPPLRIGSGWDSHLFEAGRPLWLGGLRVPHPEGLAGHSDGDVLLHAICDALLGAIAEGDIGSHFPSADPQWRDAPSSQFVRHAARLVRRAGLEVGNLDATVILESPRIGPLRDELRASVAAVLDIPPERISIKGKTPEGMNTSRAAIALATVLLFPIETDG